MKRLRSGPLVVGMTFGLLGVLLTLVGIARGAVPANPTSILIALAIGGGVWFLVAWAVATAARDVDADLATAPEASGDGVKSKSSE